MLVDVDTISPVCFQFNFEYPETGAKVERDDFMMILANVQSIYLRAAYYSLVDEIRWANSL